MNDVWVLQLQVNLAQTVKNAFEAGYKDFSELLQETTRLLRSEKGKIGNIEVLGKLVKVPPLGRALVVGDLHGDLESLVQILKETSYLQEMEDKDDSYLIFLGDYGDRGAFSAEVYYTVLKLKLAFPAQTILMRGNHEGPEDLLPSPHNLPMQLYARLGEKGNEIYLKTRALFPQLCNAVLVEDRYLMVHGGLPAKTTCIEDLAFANATHPNQSFLEEMLWSDPDETVEETDTSPRGAGKLFGKKVTNEVLGKLAVKILVRGHEPCDSGFKIDHHGKVLTLFSRKGSPYFNSCGAYLLVELSEKFENAEQLIPHIHTF